MLAAAVVLCATATAQVVEEKFPCYVEVAGYAERNVTPDTFYLSIVIAEKDSKGKISVETQQREMIAALRGMGVDTDRQLTMVDMSGEYFKKSNTLMTAQYRLKLTSAADVRKAYKHNPREDGSLRDERRVIRVQKNPHDERSERDSRTNDAGRQESDMPSRTFLAVQSAKCFWHRPITGC